METGSCMELAGGVASRSALELASRVVLWGIAVALTTYSRFNIYSINYLLFVHSGER